MSQNPIFLICSRCKEKVKVSHFSEKTTQFICGNCLRNDKVTERAYPKLVASFKNLKAFKPKRVRIPKIKQPILPRKCAFCDVEFQPNTRKRIYCSKSCKNKAIYWKAKKRKPFEPLIIECAFCGVEFEAKRITKKYCSDLCNWKAQNRKRKLRRRKKKLHSLRVGNEKGLEVRVLNTTSNLKTLKEGLSHD